MARLTVVAALIGVGATPALAQATVSAPVLAVQTGDNVMVSTPDGASPAVVARAAERPVVSRDGTRLAYTRRLDVTTQVFVANADGSAERQITTGPHSYVASDWSPDARRLALVRWRAQDGRSRLAVVNFDGSGLRDVPGSLDDRDPSWSPDGAFLVFASRTRPPEQIGLSTSRPDGADRHELVAPRSANGPTDPAWSPDGREVAFVASPYPGGRLARVDVRSRTETTLHPALDANYGEEAPTWSSDATRIYYGRHTLSVVPERFPPSDYRVQETSRDGLEVRDVAVPPGSRFPSYGGGPSPARDSLAPAPVANLSAESPPSRAVLRWVAPPDPDYAGVVVRFAPGDLAPAGPTDGLDAGRYLRDSALVRRLAPATTYSFAVFAVDWWGNAGPPATISVRTPAQIASDLSVETSAVQGVSRVLLRYGEVFTIGARLTRGDTDQPFPGQRVVLAGHVASTSSYVDLAAATTDTTGTVRFRRIPQANVTYRLRYSGDATFASAEWTGPTVLVRVKIAATFERSRIAPGGAARLRVSVAPNHAGRPVELERLSAGRWQPVGSLRLSTASTAVFLQRPTRRGVYHYRVLVRTHTDHIGNQTGPIGRTVG